MEEEEGGRGVTGERGKRTTSSSESVAWVSLRYSFPEERFTRDIIKQLHQLPSQLCFGGKGAVVVGRRTNFS